MANFAYIENNQIQEVYDLLPNNWRNFSNFFALENDLEYLKTLSWYKIQKIIPDYNPQTQKLDHARRWFENDTVYETEEVIDLEVEPIPEPLTEEQLTEIKQNQVIAAWNDIRIHRDALMNSFDWRYSRYNRELRLSISPTDNINDLDKYMQDLANITKQQDPFNIMWPALVING